MTNCFHCGDDDHLSYDCSKNTREQSATRRRLWPKGQPPEPKPSEQDKLPAYVHLDLTRRPAEEIADGKEWAAVARELLAAASGQPPDDSPLVITPFRTKFGFRPRTEAQLRAIAREQVAAHRAASAP
ncbi:MAG TPA: hypothetical protein VNO54_06570 [Streptosporangiaceae bacterium]|nr:hypothetical protein [Streptosporangiaceae bacterium]